MSARSRLSRVVAVAVVLFGLCAAFAGVTVYDDGPPVSTLITGSIVDDSDPVGAWPMGPSMPGELQGSGGRPDVTWRTVTAYPLAVWSDDDGPLDNEIAFSEWTELGWSSTALLTYNFVEDLDPRVFVENDGTTFVVWWAPESPDTVYLRRRQAGLTAWDPPLSVSDPSESARRPSVAVHNGELWVAYERDAAAPASGQQIVVAKHTPGGTFVRQVLATTGRSERLDVVLHRAQGALWIDWKHDSNDFGRAEFDTGVWSAMALEPWTDPSWVGVEVVRKVIEQGVTGE